MKELSIGDLVQIGRLSSVRDDGFIRIISDVSVDQLSEVFLIFPDNRVFLVTICDHKLFGGKDYVRFEEPETAEEMRCVKQAKLMLAPEGDVAEIDTRLIGWKVTDGDMLAGEVTDVFDNGAHTVLDVTLADGCNVMLPDVPEWIANRDDATSTLLAPRLGELTEL